jgi:hypothetical protein
MSLYCKIKAVSLQFDKIESILFSKIEILEQLCHERSLTVNMGHHLVGIRVAK